MPALFSLYLMVILYVAAGLNHFVNTRMYLKIMPSWLPAHKSLVYVSGICEIVFALLLLPVASRPIGAWLLIILLVAVFPANVQMAINYRRRGNPKLWLALLRLPLQIPLIWWCWLYT